MRLKIIDLHTIIEDSLYAIVWDDNETDTYELLLRNLRDREYLYEFFKKHKSLRNYYHIGITQAIDLTIEELELMNDELIELAKGSSKSAANLTTDFFEPLNTFDNKIYKWKHAKAKGNDPAPWIRFYAIRVDTNTYVLTGWGIKTTQSMQDDPNLTIELQKLTVAEAWLIDQGILER